MLADITIDGRVVISAESVKEALRIALE
jgi:hypothetical protein